MSDIEALQNERRGYVMRGLDDRVAQVDAAIAALSPRRAAAVETAVVDTPVETAAVAAKPTRRPKGVSASKPEE
jgi:hypothetical protein